jgi:hypothetical protein
LLWSGFPPVVLSRRVTFLHFGTGTLANNKPTHKGRLPAMDTQLSHLEQYKMLREEIMQNIREIYRTESVTAIAAAAVYTWLLLHRQDVTRVAWSIPPFLIFVATIRLLNLSIQINFVAGYLRLIEKAAFGNDTKLPGWERYTSAGAHRRFSAICNTVAGIVWVIVLVGSTVASWFLSR